MGSVDPCYWFVGGKWKRLRLLTRRVLDYYNQSQMGPSGGNWGDHDAKRNVDGGVPAYEVSERD